MPRETQPSARFVGLLFLAVLFLAGVGLFSASYMQSRSDAALRDAIHSAELLDEARSAQANFKIQVQHWKNLLLRGHDPEDFESYRTRFAEQEAVVQDNLSRMLDFPELDTAQKNEIAAIRDEHRRIGEIYREAMGRFTVGDLASSFDIDRSVRGIDQDLTQRIDTSAETILTTERARVEDISADLDALFQKTRLITSLTTGLVLLLVILLVWRLRARNRPSPRR
ncbi:hypothetical protein [Pseudooceanicola algae]|uniref:Methyl-accepting chemotaxis protein CtpH n=1 Tax=Pseudooceanicola algae TaxID=1537215 RepID=A0A418SHS6_9RHOB|nr:hypothetical protein [Pseudooceanicola algae]QPM90252.1 Methyl-accepting chemotaxis protein CtpH [Pseudooceanicola algae]